MATTFKIIDKQSLPDFVFNALRDTDLTQEQKSMLPLRILQSDAIGIQIVPESILPLESDGRPRAISELIVVSGTSTRAVNVQGRFVNPFSLAGVIVALLGGGVSVTTCVAALLSLLAACSVSLTDEQAAFFIAFRQIKANGAISTTPAIVAAMQVILKNQNFNAAQLATVVDQLNKAGLQVSQGNPPNQIVQSQEHPIFVPI